MISLSNINKQYGKQLIFVDANFQRNPGERSASSDPMPPAHGDSERLRTNLPCYPS